MFAFLAAADTTRPSQPLSRWIWRRRGGGGGGEEEAWRRRRGGGGGEEGEGDGRSVESITDKNRHKLNQF